MPAARVTNAAFAGAHTPEFRQGYDRDDVGQLARELARTIAR